MPDETELGGGRADLQPTLWSDVLKARDLSQPGAREAFERLVRLYWRPVYFFIRRHGRAVEDAKDLTQEFFARLLEKDGLRHVEAGRGRFRSYLLGAVGHFLSDQGVRRRVAPLPDADFAAAETQFRPEHSFERDWAEAVMERAFARLRQERPREAEAVKSPRAPVPELAKLLGTTEGNAKVLVHRARQRLRELLLDELHATVEDPADAEAELADLFRAFSL